MEMVHFVTFADTNLKPTLKRIEKEAKLSGFFDKIWAFDEKSIFNPFINERKDFFSTHKRGYGYWLWKPYVINYVLNKYMSEGDILVYLDSGCEIHKSGLKRWNEYKKMLDKHSLLVYDHLHSYENQFTKIDVLDYFSVLGNDQILNSRQLWAGGLMMKKNNFVCDLMGRWFEICDNNKYTLLCDQPSKTDELPTFKQHCHDQSIFSVLCKTIDVAATDSSIGDGQIKVLPMIENYPYPHDWTTMSQYPFWAKRNKVFATKNIWQRLIERLARFF